MSLRWQTGEAVATCPACGVEGRKAVVLSSDHVFPGWDPVTLLRCSCGAAFLDKLEWPDYATTGLHGVDYHVEQGFGFDPLAPILLRLPAGSVRRCLDVGCAYGLMLDFARCHFGCDAIGVDPSALAAEGARALELPIVNAYLDARTDVGSDPFDLVLCSEVLEHVAAPQALLAAIRARLAPRGVLVLTTPNLAIIDPRSTAGDLARGLSAGVHLVLYDEAALARVLARAGFAAVTIEASATTLVAFAARSPEALATIEKEGQGRAPILRYFAARADALPRSSALASGFAYRHFRDTVNVGDWPGAAASRKRLAATYEARYGFDLERPADAAARGGACHNLPAALYFSGLLELHSLRRPQSAAACFAAAVAAAEAVLARASGMPDGETESILGRSRMHVPIALAAVDAAGALQALDELGGAAARASLPFEDFTEARARTFARLVHAGAFEAAARLAPTIADEIDGRSAASPERVVALESAYCLAMLALQQDRPLEAATRFSALRERLERRGGEAAALLLEPTRRHEAQARERAAPPGADVSSDADARSASMPAAPPARPIAAASRPVIAERFVATVAGLAALRLPLDVIADGSSQRLRVVVAAEDAALGERVVTLAPQGLHADERLRCEFAPFANLAGAMFLVGVSELAPGDDRPSAVDVAGVRRQAKGRAPIGLECMAAGSAGREIALLPDESGIAVFHEARVSAAVRVAHWIDQFWCDAYGVYLSGWVHAYEHRVRRLTLTSAGRRATVESFGDRPDLLRHYPEHAHVRQAGFTLYLAAPAGNPVRLEIETDGGSTVLPLDLPEGQLPPLPPGGDVIADVSPVLRRFAELANASPGRILQIGARCEPQPDGRAPLPARLLHGPVIGLDIHPGPRVHVVGDAHGLSRVLRERSFDAVLSAAVLEHVAAPWLVAAEINRLLKPGGLTYHQVPSAWPPHSLPNDFWRFSPAALALLFGPETGFEVLATASGGPGTLLPGPGWRERFLGMPTLPVFACAEILARKVADIPPGAVAWPLEAHASQRLARAYPVDGLAPPWRERDA